jgi:hypothetical protein
MSHITQIAVVENSTAIWEYDPSQESNRILGGSLDVIAAIRMLAIKVRVQVCLLIYILFIAVRRSKHQDNVSSISKVPSSVADCPNLLKFPYTATFDGELRIEC